MKLLIILVFFYSLSLSASTEIWKLGGEFIEMKRDEKSGLLLSSSCHQKCEAWKFLKKASLKNLSSEKLSGGKNPGAVLCHDEKSAEVVFLKDLKGNDNSFCLFKDKSFVSSSSIEIEARKNDQGK